MLTLDDVRRLMTDPSAQTRAQLVGKLAETYDDTALGARELALTADIFRALLRDVEVQVRAAMAEALAESPRLPADIARALAADGPQVALPVLQHSASLSDADLIEIIGGEDMEKLLAIARRRAVSERVSHELVEHGDAECVAVLVGNAGAAISVGTFQRILDRHGADEAVQGALVGRERLPLAVAERLVTRVSDHLRRQLVLQHRLESRLAAELVMRAREKTVVGLAAGATEDDLAALVAQLRQGGRLTPSLILRALCLGDLPFAEAAFGALAGLPTASAHILLNDESAQAIPGLYRRAGLPDSHYPAIRAAIEVSRQVEIDDQPDARARLQRQIIERLLTQYEIIGIAFEGDDLDYVLERLDGLPPLDLGLDSAPGDHPA